MVMRPWKPEGIGDSELVGNQPAVRLRACQPQPCFPWMGKGGGQSDQEMVLCLRSTIE